MRSESPNESVQAAQEVGESSPEKKKKRYEAPQILSVEPLEAVAAVCDPPTPPLGKTVPIPCGALGS